MKLRVFLYLAFVLHLLAMLFYYSPVSLKGWWSDLIFMYTSILLLALVYKKMKSVSIKVILIISCVINGSFAFWSSVIPVKYIPKGKFDDAEKYAYFTIRGNTGATSGCYGQVYVHNQISWLPFLEIQTDFVPCDDLGYECWLEDC